jgi:hypothetical protein
MRASPSQVAEFLVGLHRQRLLNVPLTFLAFSLLGGIVDEQAWGVGTATQTRQSAAVYFKNGWLPTHNGWIVHSAGVLAQREEQFIYVFMTDQQPSFEQPVQTIETAVELLQDSVAPGIRKTTPPFGVDIVPFPTTTRPADRR